MTATATLEEIRRLTADPSATRKPLISLVTQSPTVTPPAPATVQR